MNNVVTMRPLNNEEVVKLGLPDPKTLLDAFYKLNDLLTQNGKELASEVKQHFKEYIAGSMDDLEIIVESDVELSFLMRFQKNLCPNIKVESTSVFYPLYPCDEAHQMMTLISVSGILHDLETVAKKFSETSKITGAKNIINLVRER
jgi:hypothetical protein